MNKKKRSKKNKERVRIRKSRYIKLDETHCYTGKFNIALSLCKVLRIVLNLINMRKVRSFIDNIMMGIEMEEVYDELVTEILEEIYLYIKLEKCKWKMREVDFLEVVIRPERTKIEEKKVKAVLDWLVPKSVKDIQKFLGLENYYRRFIEEFVKIARPLHELIRKE